jgi:hypothetical protein
MSRENSLQCRLPRVGVVLVATTLLFTSLFTIGCGGGGSSTTPPPPPPGSSAAQIKIGDAPADRVISFEVSVGPITLTPSSGSPITVLNAARRVELTHLSATSEPLSLLNIPQGTYTSATLTVADPEVVFLNGAGVPTKLEDNTFSQQITINFNPALNVSAAASVVNIDLNVANALTFDLAGNVTGFSLSASSFNVSTSAVANENQQEHENGELEDLTGQVTAVNGTSFTLDVNGTSLTFTTDANTEFNDGASLGTMLNTIVEVEGVTRADGTLYAKEVEGIENQNGMELEGLITSVTGTPATSLTIVAQDGHGSGVDDSKIGSTFTVDVTGAQYKVNKGNIDTSGIGGLPSSPNFPFDANSVHAGQRVEVDDATGLGSGTITAEKIKLQQQTITGQITSVGTSTFTLSVPADSAFAILSGGGTPTVNVFVQPGTDNRVGTFTVGSAVRVRGLLFNASGTFNMIARRITP